MRSRAFNLSGSRNLHAQIQQENLQRNGSEAEREKRACVAESLDVERMSDSSIAQELPDPSEHGSQG